MSSSILPVAPGALLGYTRSGRPIFLQAGGSTDNPPPEQDGQAPTTPPAATPPVPEPKAEQQSVKDLPEWAQKQIRELRAESAGHRTKANAAETANQQQLDAIAEALGLKKGTEVDPAKLKTELTQAQDAQRQSALELAVYKAAGKDVDVSALLDSKSFERSLRDLDLSAKDFGKQLGDLIEQAVKDNDRLKLTPAAPKRSGGDASGGPGEQQKRPTSLTDAVRRSYG